MGFIRLSLSSARGSRAILLNVEEIISVIELAPSATGEAEVIMANDDRHNVDETITAIWALINESRAVE